MAKFKKVLIELLIWLTAGALIGLIATWFGFGSGEAVEYYNGSNNIADAFLPLVIVFSSLLVGIFFHLIIHEVGHLIAGSMSGYGFVSFSIANLTIANNDGKLVRKKNGITFFGGQCLMSPPDVSDEQYRFPLTFYSLCGGFANIIFSILFLIIGLLTTGNVSIAFFVLAFIGIMLGLTNLIPLKMGGVANDGMNLLICFKSTESRRAFWIQLKVIAGLTKGVRLSDMSKVWFDDKGNPIDDLTGFLSLLRCYYLMDTNKLEQARDYAKSAIENAGGMSEHNMNELRCEILFTELVFDCRIDEVEKLYSEKLKEHIKVNTTSVGNWRLMYAYELLYTKDEVKANEALAQFEKLCLQTPFVGEVAGERELVELVKQAAK